MSDVYFIDRELELEILQYDEEVRLSEEPQERKTSNWEWCNKTFLNPLYANGKRYKFRLKCGNTRKCPKCRKDLVKRLVNEMRVGVPLYCHLISDKDDVWANWQRWFSRNRTDLDRYWRYPLKNGAYMVVSTMKRYKDVPLFDNSVEQIDKWVDERGDTGKITRSENPVNCSNPSCRILFMARKKICPECGTEYSRESTKPIREKAIAIPKMTETEQEFFDEILSFGILSDSEWDVSPEKLNGRSIEDYIASLVAEARRMASKNV